MTANRKTLNLLITLLVVALLFSAYYYLLLPVKDSVKSVKSAIDALALERNEIEAKLDAVGLEDEAENERELLAKLPKNRDTQIILQLLQKSELTTGSVIESIVFNDYDTFVNEKPITGLPDEQGEETREEGENAETEVENAEPPTSQLTSADIPHDLQLLTFEISVLHENYDQLLSFLREIEKQDRVINIEAVQFDLPGEMTEFEEMETATSTIQMTTFYLKD